MVCPLFLFLGALRLKLRHRHVTFSPEQIAAFHQYIVQTIQWGEIMNCLFDGYTTLGFFGDNGGQSSPFQVKNCAVLVALLSLRSQPRNGLTSLERVSFVIGSSSRQKAKHASILAAASALQASQRQSLKQRMPISATFHAKPTAMRTLSISAKHSAKGITSHLAQVRSQLEVRLSLVQTSKSNHASR
jgi:hypothetical protein